MVISLNIGDKKESWNLNVCLISRSQLLGRQPLMYRQTFCGQTFKPDNFDVLKSRWRFTWFVSSVRELNQRRSVVTVKLVKRQNSLFLLLFYFITTSTIFVQSFVLVVSY